MFSEKLAIRVAVSIAFVCAFSFSSVAIFTLMMFSKVEQSSAEEAARGQVSAVVDLLELTFQTHEANGHRKIRALTSSPP